MSFVLGKPIDNLLLNQIDVRQKALQKPGIGGENHLYFSGKSPWIRLTSGVDVNNSPELAKLNILTNAVKLAGESPVQGYYQSDTLGFRPMPGIVSMNLRTHNRYGSLRTATVQFMVHSVEQLNIYEQLFLRPGYSALLEWGHSKYLRPDNGFPAYAVENITTLADFFEQTTVSGINQELKRLREKYHYNYDAMYGIMKNFSWSLDKNGSYNCSVDIVSIGSTLESLPINIAVTNANIATYSKFINEQNASERTQSTTSNQQASNTLSYRAASIDLEPTQWVTESDEALKNALFEHFTAVIRADTNKSGIDKVGIESRRKVTNRETGLEEQVDYEHNESMSQISVVDGKYKASHGFYRYQLTKVRAAIENQVVEIRSPEIMIFPVEREIWYAKDDGGLYSVPGDAEIIDDALAGETWRFDEQVLTEITNAAIRKVFGPPLVGDDKTTGETSLGTFKINEDGNSQVIILSNLRENGSGTKNDLPGSSDRVPIFTHKVYTYTIEPLTAPAASTTTSEDGTTSNTGEAGITDIFEIVGENDEGLASRIHFLLYQVKRTLSNQTSAGVMLNRNWYYKIESNYNKVKTKEALVNDKESLGLEEYQYIQLGFFLDVLNDCIPQTTDTGERLFEFYTGTAVKHYMKTIPKFHYSVDPAKCLLPDNSPKDVLEIWVEINYIYRLVENYFYTGTVKVYELLSTLFEDLNAAFGSINSFELQYFEDSNKFHVVDREVMDPDALADGEAVISIFGKNSFVRDFNVVSKLSPAISSQLAIAAQADPLSNGLEGTGWNYFNRNLTDRLRKDLKDTFTKEQQAAQRAEAAELQAEALLKQYADVYQFLLAVYPAAGSANANYKRPVENVIPQYATFCKAQLVDVSKAGQDFGFIIPYELSLTLDGIAGFNVMQSFKIVDDLIPSSYKGNETTGVAFLVTGLTQVVNTQGWQTTVKAQIYNTNKKGRSGAPLEEQPQSNTTTETTTTEETNTNVTVPAGDEINDNDLWRYLAWQQGSGGSAEHYQIAKGTKNAYRLVTLAAIKQNWPGSIVASNGVTKADIDTLYTQDPTKLAIGFIDAYKQHYANKNTSAINTLNQQGNNQAGLAWSAMKQAFAKASQDLPELGISYSNLITIGFIENALQTDTRAGASYKSLFQMTPRYYRDILDKYREGSSPRSGYTAYASTEATFLPYVKDVMAKLDSSYKSFKRVSGYTG